MESRLTGTDRDYYRLTVDGLPGSYASEQTFNDEGQKSAWETCGATDCRSLPISSKPVSGQPVNSDRLLDTRAFTGTDSRKTFRPPTTSFLKAYSSAVAIDGGFQYGPTSHDPTRALGGVDGVGAFGGTGTRVNGCPSPSDVSNSAF
jgi:hypothetical protein